MEGQLAAAEDEKAQLRGLLEATEGRVEALKAKLDDVQARGDKLKPRLDESDGRVWEFMAEAAGLRSEVEELASKNKEGSRQLKEIAAESSRWPKEIAAEKRELQGRLRSAEDGLRREISRGCEA